MMSFTAYDIFALALMAPVFGSLTAFVWVVFLEWTNL